MPTNLERIEEEIRKRQQAGKTDAPTTRERQQGPRTPRTDPDAPAPWEMDLARDENGNITLMSLGAANTARYATHTAADPAAIAARQIQVQTEQEEKQRKRGRAATIMTSPLGDMTAPQLARKSLMGY